MQQNGTTMPLSVIQENLTVHLSFPLTACNTRTLRFLALMGPATAAASLLEGPKLELP